MSGWAAPCVRQTRRILAAALHIAQSLDQFERRLVTRSEYNFTESPCCDQGFCLIVEEANPKQDNKGVRNFRVTRLVAA